MAAEVVLVGVVHRDPRGELLLARVLGREEPDAIGLELSAPSLEARRDGRMVRRLAQLLRALGKDRLAEAVEKGERLTGRIGQLAASASVPFELKAAEAHALATGARVVLLDDPRIAARAVALIETEVLTEPNVQALLEEDAREPGLGAEPEEQYRLARRYFEEPRLFRYHFSADGLAEMVARDAFVTEGLERLAQGCSKIVHVAGWEHLIDAGARTLYGRWKGRARRILLDEALGW